MESNRTSPRRALRRTALMVVVALVVSALIMPLAASENARADTAPNATKQSGNTSAPDDTTMLSDPNYKLGSGDLIRVIVYGQPDLSGEFHVDGNGKVALPLVGAVEAGGKSVSQFEKSIAGALQPDYLHNPRVSVEVLSYRPFYIVGEVRNPGNYPYTDGMTVINAVAMAGGFTYRAKDDDFTISRSNNSPDAEAEEANQNTKVHPGDVITVPERWF